MRLRLLAGIAVVSMLISASTPPVEGRSADRRIFLSSAPAVSQNGTSDDTRKQPNTNKKRDQDSPEITSAEFSESVAERLVQQLGDGLQDHNARHMLSAFDADGMERYANFQDQVAALFERYDSFRVHFRIAEIRTEGATGVVLLDFEIEEASPSSDTPVRRNDRLQLEIKKGKNGWKIVDLKPRAFFSS
jgi:hypothetical protein